MKYDIVLTGIGGQGVLSMVKVLAPGARRQGLYVKQSESRGLARRGAPVVAHLRLADRPVASDLVPRGCADLVVATEPLEALHCLTHLAPTGTLASASAAVANVPDYPDPERLLAAIRSLPRHILVDAEQLARQAGSTQAANMVMIGAIAHLLPLARENLAEHVGKAFAAAGDQVVATNLRAFEAGLAGGFPSGKSV